MISTDFRVSTTKNIDSIKPFSSEEVESKLEKIEEKLKDLPSVLDKDTLNKLKDGEYEITLKEYSDMNTYRTKMTLLYGNSSASKLPSALNNILGNWDDSDLTSKEFIEQLEDRGIDKESALKLYQAMKSYTLINTFTKSYVSAIV